MSDIPTVADGQEILAAWNNAAAARINRMLPMYLSSDQATNSASYVNLGDLNIPVVSGRTYSGSVLLRAIPAAGTMGIGLAFTTPGGTLLHYNDIYNGAGGAGIANTERTTASDGPTGSTTSDNTNMRLHVVRFCYQCTADGTLQMRFKRGGTSTAPGQTVYKGSGCIVLETA